MALVAAMVRAGWSPATAWWTLINPRHAGGKPLLIDRHGRPRRKPERYFEQAWGVAEEFVARTPQTRDRGELLEQASRVREAADSAPWRGRAGATDRAVLEVLITTVEKVGRMDVAAGTRYVAERAGIDPRTASRSLHRLRQGGWIRRVRPSTRIRAAVYRIRVGTPTPHSGVGGTVPLHPDVFGLGRAGLGRGEGVRPPGW